VVIAQHGHRADIRRELKETSHQVLQDAMKDTVKQITETVGHMAEKLREYGNKERGKRSFFFDSLIDSVRDFPK
jgi:hypothetical protein